MAKKCYPLSYKLKYITFLRFSCHSKGLFGFLCEIRLKLGGLRNGYCKIGLLRFLKNWSPPNLDNLELEVNKELVNINSNHKIRESLKEEEDSEEEEGECYAEEIEDIVALKKMIKIERKRANSAYLELEKERMAAASAAEEAMAMILRLQNEKSSIEIQAHQCRRLAEQKQLYDHEVIQSLRWIILKQESERGVLEGQLKLCRQRLKHYPKADKGDQLEGVDLTLDFSCSTMEDDLDDVLISSLDMDS